MSSSQQQPEVEPPTDGGCQTAVTNVNGRSCAPLRMLINVLKKSEGYVKGHIYIHICSVNQATADEPASILLCPICRAALSSYWMLMMSTPALVAADLRFGPPPSLMMVLAHRLGRNWQAKPAGICWGSARPWL